MEISPRIGGGDSPPFVLRKMGSIITANHEKIILPNLDHQNFGEPNEIYVSLKHPES